MTSRELREKYLKFFEKKGHKIIPSVPLVPENDASTLFISAGMQPLVPYLLGEAHPMGKRLVNCQKCIRTGDIDEVGDTFHHTFFEMLGNWSLGDYFKKESIPWSFEFLTKELNILPDRLSVSVFAGDGDAPQDEEAAELWKSVGIPKERIYYFGKEDNWWAAGPTGPCGPDTEIFYDVTQKPCGPDCRPGDNCGRYFEIWNNVFMVYNRKEDGSLEELPKKNIDTGMGVERTITVLNGLDDDYQTDLWQPLIKELESRFKIKYGQNKNIDKSMRIIADHIKAAVFLIKDGVLPTNKLQGYVLRRLIRRAAIKISTVKKGEMGILYILADIVLEIYKNTNYFKNRPAFLSLITTTERDFIVKVIDGERKRFESSLEKGLRELEKYPQIDGKVAFDLYQSYGFPLEVTKELAEEKGQKINEGEFKKEFEEHQNKSRTSSAGMFKGGLAGDTLTMRKYHTTAHLLQAALRKVLGEHIEQAGQNITDERLRFDFRHSESVSVRDRERVEAMINEKIEKDLPVTSKVMPLEEAYAQGALGFFKDKYGEQVSVYTIGDPSTSDGRSGFSPFSREICGGPHVATTGEIGRVKIVKEESAGAGVRRIYIKID